MSPPWGRLRAFVRLGRLHFLVGGVLMHALGVAIALYAGARLDLPALLWGQLAITATQLMTHYSNEYFDLPADRLNPAPTTWSGGSRVLPDERLPAGVARVAAYAMLALAVAMMAGLLAVVRPGRAAAPLLLAALILTWGYSAPPLRLHSRGLGELTVALAVPGLATLLGYYLQAGALAPLPFLAMAPLCCLQFTMILTANLADLQGDVPAGKKTLAVRLGKAGATRLHHGVLATAYLSLPALVWAGLPLLPAAALGLTAPLAAVQIWRVGRAGAAPATWGSLIFWAVALLVGAAGLELLAFAALAWRAM